MVPRGEKREKRNEIRKGNKKKPNERNEKKEIV